MLNNLDRLFAEAETRALINPRPMPTGTRAEIGAALLLEAEKRDADLEAEALKAEREGDHEGTWLAMATRAENKRFMERLRADLEAINKAPEVATAA